MSHECKGKYNKCACVFHISWKPYYFLEEKKNLQCHILCFFCLVWHLLRGLGSVLSIVPTSQFGAHDNVVMSFISTMQCTRISIFRTCSPSIYSTVEYSVSQICIIMILMSLFSLECIRRSKLLIPNFFIPTYPFPRQAPHGIPGDARHQA